MDFSLFSLIDEMSSAVVAVLSVARRAQANTWKPFRAITAILCLSHSPSATCVDFFN